MVRIARSFGPSTVLLSSLALLGVTAAACSSTPPAEPAPADAAPPISSAVDASRPPPSPDAAVPDAAIPCGKGQPKKCSVGEGCVDPVDCESLNCTEGACVASSCTNKQQDGKETGVDCGGTCATHCDGEPCTKNEDCQSTTCAPDKTCAPPGTKTCGVGLPNPCELGDVCLQDRDCAVDYCRALSCTAPPATVHQDGRRDGGETGVDCGGAAAPALLCGAGQPCKVSDDCVSTCTAGFCDAPSATDGKKNNGETDIDCGGPNAPRCLLTHACATNNDCQLRACTGNVCVTPTSSDNVKNGLESDIDCGGGAVTEGGVTYQAPACKDDKTCGAGADCLSLACSPGGRCSARSCATAETSGIGTCGTKEVGEVGAAHESCCRSLTLPTRTTRRLDKYEITAGRMRSFIGDVGPNVRAWVSTYVAANPASQLGQLVTLAPVVGNLYPSSRSGPLNIVAHLGAIDIDNYNGIRGCSNWYDVGNPASGNFGASTYWQPDADLAQYGIPTRTIPRTTLDTKPLTCVTPIMLAAFCAWDGGELARHADFMDAWGPYGQPMGPTDPGRPAYNWCNGRPGNGGWGCQDTSLGNGGIFYEFPKNQTESRDLSIWIASPGRFATDATYLKSGGESWYDLFANLGEYTGDFTAPNYDFCDFSTAPEAGATTCTRSSKPVGSVGTLYTGIPLAGMVGRSWEGHNYGRGGPNYFQAMFQYGKFGGRCVRPTQ